MEQGGQGAIHPADARRARRGSGSKQGKRRASGRDGAQISPAGERERESQAARVGCFESVDRQTRLSLLSCSGRAQGREERRRSGRVDSTRGGNKEGGGMREGKTTRGRAAPGRDRQTRQQPSAAMKAKSSGRSATLMLQNHNRCSIDSSQHPRYKALKLNGWIVMVADAAVLALVEKTDASHRASGTVCRRGCS